MAGSSCGGPLMSLNEFKYLNDEDWYDDFEEDSPIPFRKSSEDDATDILEAYFYEPLYKYVCMTDYECG